MESTIFQVLPSTNPYDNLATEKQLFLGRRDSFVLLWRNDPCVIVGYNQDIDRETTPLCRQSVPVLRRFTGGGAVYQDLDNVNFTFIQNGETDIRTAVEPILTFLQGLGVPVTFSGRNDLVVEGKKVSGCAQKISGNRILTHGTLLFRRDEKRMQAYLSPPKEKLLRHGVSSVAARTGQLADYLPQFENTADFMAALADYLQCKKD